MAKSSVILFFLFQFLNWTLYGQADTIWHTHPDSAESIGYSLIQEHDDTLNGPVEHYFYNSDQLAESYYVKNGKKYGAYRKYYENGELREFTVYSNDVPNGEFTWYDERGEITIKGKYRMGVRWGYWAYRNDACYGRYKKGYKHKKWKCYDASGSLSSRTHFRYGEQLTGKNDSVKDVSENKKKEAAIDPEVAANMKDNPRFRQNIFVGQKVIITYKPGTKSEKKIEGKVAVILTKKSFHGIGIKVQLESGEEGRVLEMIDPPPTIE